MELRSIGQAAKATGVKVPTIRYYEKIGLIAPSARTRGRQRLFDATALKRLHFIAHARQLGFGLPEIRQLLDLSDRPAQSCGEADRIARAHLLAVQSRIERLTALKRELEHMIGSCASGAVADCRIIETLSDHGKCLADEH